MTEKELINTQELDWILQGLNIFHQPACVYSENAEFMNVKGTMKLIHVSDIIQDVFDITGFADILSIE